MAFTPKIPAYSTQGKSFSRTAAFPLEGYEIWTDLEALEAYAANTDPAKDPSYIGQKVAYIDTENNRVVHYGIEIDGSLKELGADKMGVDALTAADDGKIPKAFYVVDTPASGEEGAEDYQPEVGHVEIRWVIPEAFEDTNTVTTVKSSDGSVSVTETKTSASEKEFDIKVDISGKLDANGWTNEDGLLRKEGVTEDGFSTNTATSIDEDGISVWSHAGTLHYGPYGITGTVDDAYTGKFEVTDRNIIINDKEFNYPTQSGTLVVNKDLVDYTVSVTTDEVEDSNLKHYVFNQCGKEIAHIDIPKDLVVQSGEVIVATADDKTNDDAVVVGDTYIKLVIANQEKPLYIAAKDLVDIYTVADTNTVDMTITGTKIKADVKISAETGNSLVAKKDGLYVNAPVLPTSADAAAENQYVTAVDQKDGKVTVTRKQISYNELADLPTIPGTSDFGILAIEGKDAIKATTEAQNTTVELILASGENAGNVVLTQDENGLAANVTIPDVAIAATVDKVLPTDNKPVTDKVIAALAAEGHTVTPTVLEVVTKAGWDKIVGENGIRVLTQEEINKLDALNIESDGNVAISGTINAANVHGLGSEVIDLVTGTGEYISTPAIGEEGNDNYVPAVIVQKLGIEKGAQVNKIEAVALPDAVLAITEKQVNIPAALEGKYGVIKGGNPAVANEVSVVDGIGKVAKVDVDTLVGGGDDFILYGGNATAHSSANA